METIKLKLIITGRLDVYELINNNLVRCLLDKTLVSVKINHDTKRAL